MSINTSSASMDKPEPLIRVADSPFNDDDADTILRSSDHIDFFVHSAMLSVVSPVFRDLFDLPQVQSPRSTSPTGYSLKRFVQMTEDRHSLDLFLRWCDTRAHIPVKMSIPDIATVIHLADKFQMEGVAGRVGPHLYRFIDSEPFSVYLLSAFHASLGDTEETWGNDLARRAAKQLLSQQMPFQPPVHKFFKDMPAVILEPLYHYHRACGISIRQTIERKNIEWFCEWPWLRECTCAHTQYHYLGETYVPVWWKAYLTRLGELLAKQPSVTTILQLDFNDALMTLITRQCQCISTGPNPAKPVEVLHEVKNFTVGLLDMTEKAIKEVMLDFSKAKAATT
ncbi:hypothetical protein BDP27DRAFT_1326752 [Rhodocollybia butyracea]|uniref:BTB domain-containing protein n=1 Tax=Rhodocollybia butyracea TaxID=206335 RepID=A0A9P5PUC7_9AGAR|nr:hypothetical protein BDP27DRAFT_1326752 [Rhodocollybia butyracea]